MCEVALVTLHIKGFSLPPDEQNEASTILLIYQYANLVF